MQVESRDWTFKSGGGPEWEAETGVDNTWCRSKISLCPAAFTNLTAKGSDDN